jgi:hypothetical protein
MSSSTEPMAKPQATTSKATSQKGYQMVPVIGPSEGVDLRLSQTLLPPGRARTLINFSLEEPGALVMRPGFLHFSTSALGAARLQGGARIYLNTALPTPTSTIVTLVAFNQTIVSATDSGGWNVASLSGLSTNEVYFPADRDLVVAMDGSSRLMKSTNGSSWTAFGLTRPAAGPTLSSLSTGGLSSGEYEINFTYKAHGLAVESNGAVTGSTITIGASSGAINAILTNSTNPDVNAIVVYARQKTSGETILRKVSSLAQSAGVSSTLVITSTAWTTNDPLPTDHDAPVALSFGVVWKNRWWARDATTTNRLRFTQIFQPQSWPALFYIDIPFERGDSIQAIISLGNTLLVFGATKIFLILGQTSLDFEVLPTLASQDGALGPRAVCVLENGVIHAGAAGVWIFDGVSDRLLSYDLDPAWKDLVANAAADALARVACTYHLQRKELRIAVPRRYPSGAPGEWVLDMNRSRNGQTAWTATDRDITGYIPWDGPETVAGNRGRLLSWPSTQAKLMEEAVGYTADGGNQTGSYEGPGLTLGAFRGRWVDLRGEYEPHGGALSAQAVVDESVLPSIAIPIGAGQAVYGTGTYGTALYAGSGRRQFYTPLHLEADGRTLVQRLTYVGQEKWKLFSYHVGIVPEPRSRAFSE